MTKVMVSGGFDPLHVGHLDLFESAAQFGEIIVIVMSDEWLIRKKGYCVMKQVDRSQIVLAVYCVKLTHTYWGDADDISSVLDELKPDMFCNGGDRTEANEAEHLICVRHGIVEAFNVGGKKRRSSSELISRAMSPNVVPLHAEEEN